MIRRAVALWALLFAAYALTLGLDAAGGSNLAPGEARHLLAAASVVDDRDLDLRDEYRERRHARFHPQPLAPAGGRVAGRLREPVAPGFPLLVAPAFALAGAVGAQLLMAALAALAGTLAHLLALRVVPDPWALGAALAVALSPPALVNATAVAPEVPGAAALAGAALLAARVDRGAPRRRVAGCFALLAATPWLALPLAPAAVALALGAAIRLVRLRRSAAAAVALEGLAASGFAYVAVNLRLFGGPTPDAVALDGEPAVPAAAADLLARGAHLAALLVDREAGLLRWSPVLLLSVVGAWWLARSRRQRLAAALPRLREAEAVSALCLAGLAGGLAGAVLLEPHVTGPWFAGLPAAGVLALAVAPVAAGLRRVPRTGTALALVGIAASAWLVAAVALGGAELVSAPPDAPWGPLEAAFPRLPG